jgi:retron-type reverse transcriptase
MSKLKQLFKQDELRKSYKALRHLAKASPSHGVDKIKFKDFDGNARGHLQSISREVIGKRYQHQGLRPFSIPKSDGSERWIAIPTHRDRLVQRVLKVELSETYRSSIQTGVGFGSLRYIGVEQETDAAKLACELKTKFPFIVKTDIGRFFDNINRNDAKSALRSVVRHRSLLPILYQIVDAEIVGDSTTRKKLEKGGIRRGLGIRQGMPLSPLLAHIVLKEFDEFTINSNIKIIRYVDDILILSDSAIGVERDFTEVRNWLREERDLTVAPIGQGKTSQYGPEETFEFLGIKIFKAPDGSWCRGVPDGLFQRIKERVEERIPADQSGLKPRSVTSALAFLSSMRESYIAAYGGLAGWRKIDYKISELEAYAIKRFARLVAPLAQRDASITSEIRKAFSLKP